MPPPAPKLKFDLKEYLKAMKTTMEKALSNQLKPSSKNKLITEAMNYSLLAGGKRVRPIMVLATCAMFRKRRGEDHQHGPLPDPKTLELAMPTAVALEMIHTMSLIHDDLPAMDNDDLRRGMPTNHKKFGEDIAILAGDALLSEAFATIARDSVKVGVPPAQIVEVINRVGDAVGPNGLAAGQVLDLECERRDVSNPTTLEELRWMHVHKTGVLLKVAVACGAIIGGADLHTEVPRLERYANAVGLAFQVVDDLLDVTASTDELGKTAGKDEATNKATYPKLLGVEGSQKEAKRLMDESLRELEVFGDEADSLRAIAKFIVGRTN